MQDRLGDSLGALLTSRVQLSLDDWWGDRSRICAYPTMKLSGGEGSAQLGVDVVSLRALMDGGDDHHLRIFGDPFWLNPSEDLSYHVESVGPSGRWVAKRLPGNPMTEIWAIERSECDPWLRGVEAFCKVMSGGKPVYLGGSELRIV